MLDDGAAIMVRPADALDRLTHCLAPTRVGPLFHQPALAVDLTGIERAELAALAGCARHAPCVVIGSVPAGTQLPAREAAAFDVLLRPEPSPPHPFVGCPDVGAPTPADAVARLTAAVAASPDAAVALVQLLRASEALDVEDAIGCESFVYSMLQSGARFQGWLARRGAVTHRTGPGPAVLLRRIGSELHVTLNRPHVRNAVDAALRDGLIDAFATVTADPTIRRAVVTGHGPSFCSGGDLSEFGTSPDPVTAHHVRTARSAGSWLARCARRTTVDVHGSCIGAGVEIAAFAGWVRATPDTTCTLPELSMGLVPGAGGTVSIPRRIGRQRTAYLALSGEPLPARVALEWGLVDEIREPPVAGTLSDRAR